MILSYIKSNTYFLSFLSMLTALVIIALLDPDPFNSSAHKPELPESNLASVATADSLVVAKRKIDPDGREHVYFMHYFQGNEVLGSTLIMHKALPHETLDRFTNQLVKDLHARHYDHYLSEEEVLKAVSDHYPHVVIRLNKEMVWVPAKLLNGPTEAHLCFQMNAEEDALELYIDASTGEEVLSINQTRALQNIGKAHTRYSGVVDIFTEKDSSGFRLTEIRKGTRISTLSADNKTVEDITNNFEKAPDLDKLSTFSDTDNEWKFDQQDLDQIATDIHWGTEMAFDYFNDIHNHKSIDGKGGDINNIIHLGIDWDEAFFLPPPFNFLGYGDGGPIGPNATLDIVAHEYTHAVVRYTANLIYINESAILDEGIADIFATAVKFHLQYAPVDDKWKLAEQLGTFRDLRDPKSKGQPDTYLGEHWCCGNNRPLFAHNNNGPLNYWFYLLSEGGNGINDNDHSYNIVPIGIDKVAEIVFRALSFYLAPTSGYYDMRVACSNAAKDIYGENSQELVRVKEAWDAVGVLENITQTEVVNMSPKVITLYPNPTKGILHVQSEVSTASEINLKVFSLSGQELWHKSYRSILSPITLDLQKLTTGQYTLEYDAADKVIRKVFFKI